MTNKELEMAREIGSLRSIIHNIWWMARRYAHGRQSYAVGQYNDAIKAAQKLGMKFEPDPVDGLIEAKDAMFDREWFEKRPTDRQSVNQKEKL